MTGESESLSRVQTDDAQIRRACLSGAPWLCRDRRTSLRPEKTLGCALGQACRGERLFLARSCAPARHGAASHEFAQSKFASVAQILPSYRTCPADRGRDALPEC